MPMPRSISASPPTRSSRPCEAPSTVPLTNDGRVVGVLSCYAASAPGFTEDHLRLLELLAASLGSAIASVDRGEAPALPVAANADAARQSNVLTMVQRSRVHVQRGTCDARLDCDAHLAFLRTRPARRSTCGSTSTCAARVHVHGTTLAGRLT